MAAHGVRNDVFFVDRDDADLSSSPDRCARTTLVQGLTGIVDALSCIPNTRYALHVVALGSSRSVPIELEHRRSADLIPAGALPIFFVHESYIQLNYSKPAPRLVPSYAPPPPSFSMPPRVFFHFVTPCLYRCKQRCAHQRSHHGGRTHLPASSLRFARQLRHTRSGE